MRSLKKVIWFFLPFCSKSFCILYGIQITYLSQLPPLFLRIHPAENCVCVCLCVSHLQNKKVIFHTVSFWVPFPTVGRRVFPSSFQRVGGFSLWYLGEIVTIWRGDVAKVTERLYKVTKSSYTVSFPSESYPRTQRLVQ